MLSILFLPRVHSIGLLLVKVISSVRRRIRGCDFLVQQCLPVEILHPDMLLHLVRTIQAESISRFTLETFINEICRFQGPPIGYFVLSNLDLLRENVIPYFLPSFPIVRPLSEHELKSNNAKSEIVDCTAMILSAHYFWGHIARCATGVLTIFGSPNPCNTQICDSYIAQFIHDDILRFNVSMDHSVVVHVFQAYDHAGNHEFYICNDRLMIIQFVGR